MFANVRRLRRDEDGPAIEALFVSAHSDAMYPIGSPWSQEQIAAECLEAEGLVSVIEFPAETQINAGALAGFIFYRDLKYAWEISFLAVDQRFRGNGVMQRLLLKMQSELQAGQEIWLEVHEANLPARRLYEKLGFYSTAVRLRYYRDGGAAVLYTFQRDSSSNSGV
jgi:ribosomal protein S18 acetylase RimI-like enzyme